MVDVKEDIKKKLKLLNKETDKIFAELEVLPTEILQKKGKGWSLIQVLSHLRLAELSSLKYMQKKVLAGDQMPNSNSLNHFRMTWTKWLLSSSLKWKAPKVVSMPKDSYTLDELKSKWNHERLLLEKYVEEYPDELLKKAVYKHPFAGRQALKEAVDSFIYHQRHHLHQIRRIKKELGI